MSKVGSWSTTAGNNNSTPPDGWPEGQAPSTVNDCAREMMAQIRTMLDDLQYIDLAHTPTQTGSTTFTLPGNVVSFYDYGHRVKCFDGASTLYGTVISSSFTTNTGVTLRLDSGALTTSLSSIAISVLSNANRAIPDPALNSKAINTNGHFDIWQNTVPVGISGSGQAVYITDFWVYGQNASSVVNGGRLERSASASHVPTIAQTGQLLNSSLVLSVSAVDAALAASDYARLSTTIEGFDYRQIAGKPFTVSFWVQTNRTGTYCLAAGNNVDRTYIQEYAISAANTWEKKTLTFPEPPTAGTWDYSNGLGLVVHWALASGTAFQSTANQWTSMAALATSNQTNWLASAGHAFRIAGVKINEGTHAFPLEFRPYSEELKKAKRQYQTYSGVKLGFAIGANNALFNIEFEEEFRATPTVTFPTVNFLTASDGTAGTDYSASSVASTATGSKNHEFIVSVVGTPLTAGQGSELNISSGGAIIYSARF